MEARAKVIQGKGRVKITTKANGRIKTARMEQSTGSAVLDEHTRKTARIFWQGPSDASTVVPIEYRLPPGTWPFEVFDWKGWHVTKPPYPKEARRRGIEGVGAVQTTTDQTGRVMKTQGIKSTGSAALNAYTDGYIRATWSGPPNSQVAVPIIYRLMHR